MGAQLLEHQREVSIFVGTTNDGFLEVSGASSVQRIQELCVAANEVFNMDDARVEAFLNRAYVAAGNQTPLEMAKISDTGLNTALCLLRPRAGC